MSLSIEELRKSLLVEAREAIAPLVQQLRGPSAVLPVLVGAEHRRMTAIRARLAEIECEMEETLTRRNANARRLDSLCSPPALRPPEPVANTVSFPFVGKWGRP
ncbi:MAG TPA: hypothetical protein VGE08_03975 [Steroidobacter sp.]|uniref:hypothetical protein n=1 Tax=Steroidobacter sp. TaxID=1978227 RepID=UPI002EDBA5E9